MKEVLSSPLLITWRDAIRGGQVGVLAEVKGLPNGVVELEPGLHPSGRMNPKAQISLWMFFSVSFYLICRLSSTRQGWRKSLCLIRIINRKACSCIASISLQHGPQKPNRLKRRPVRYTIRYPQNRETRCLTRKHNLENLRERSQWRDSTQQCNIINV